MLQPIIEGETAHFFEEIKVFLDKDDCTSCQEASDKFKMLYLQSHTVLALTYLL